MSNKVTREILVDLSPEEVEERRRSLAENSMQLTAWEEERKRTLAPIDAEGKHLNQTRKKLYKAINEEQELRSVECEWFETATQRELRRLDNGRVVEQEPLTPIEIRDRQPPTPAPAAPAAGEPLPPIEALDPRRGNPPTSDGSAPPRALPEHAGPADDGEAEEWQGGDIAPPAPAPAPRALPAGPQAGSTVDVEIVDEAAEHNKRETWRGLVLDALANRALAHGALLVAVSKGVAGRGVGIPTLSEFRGLMASMVASQAVELTDDEVYRRPDPAPKAKPASKKSKGKRGRSGRKAAELEAMGALPIHIDEELLTSEQVAAVLKVSVKTARLWMRTRMRHLPGKKLLVTKRALASYLAQREEEPAWPTHPSACAATSTGPRSWASASRPAAGTAKRRSSGPESSSASPPIPFTQPRGRRPSAAPSPPSSPLRLVASPKGR